jgi:hypothetical protein
MAFDPRGKRDRYANYFQNNRDIALISYDYSVENPDISRTPSASTRIESRSRLARTIYFVAVRYERLAFRI